MATAEGKRLTAGERRAWRVGFRAGVQHCIKQLELFDLRFIARGNGVDAPRTWLVVEPGRRGAA